jgi:hypothetical protein
MSNLPTYVVEFDGSLVQRGFWLYVLEATTPDGNCLLYVGRTGDSSSFNAQSAYNRLGQHLGNAKTTSQMRKHLTKQGLEVEECRFRFVVCGPVFEEGAAKDRESHYPLRDLVAPMEKALAERLSAAGYTVLNTVPSRKSLDEQRFKHVLEAFADHFQKLTSVETA